jgi:hypothetical protein
LCQRKSTVARVGSRAALVGLGRRGRLDHATHPWLLPRKPTLLLSTATHLPQSHRLTSTTPGTPTTPTRLSHRRFTRPQQCAPAAIACDIRLFAQAAQVSPLLQYPPSRTSVVSGDLEEETRTQVECSGYRRAGVFRPSCTGAVCSRIACEEIASSTETLSICVRERGSHVYLVHLAIEIGLLRIAHRRPQRNRLFFLVAHHIQPSTFPSI